MATPTAPSLSSGTTAAPASGRRDEGHELPPPTAANQRYRAVFDRRTADELRLIARIKRLLERHEGDAGFRARLAEPGADWRAIATGYGLEIDPREVAPLLIRDAGARDAAIRESGGPLVRTWLDYTADLAGVGPFLVGAGDCPEANPAFHAWRQRQIRRAVGELGDYAKVITHPILAFELTAGCSVGCWFCGISAGKLQGAFSYNDENRQLWRAVLEQSLALFGSAAQSGFCYWATEPADNPDYPDFIEDFYRVTGALPSTTSAMPVRDPAWTRRVLRLHDAFGGLLNRFSILNLRMLDRVHQTFTADELLGVRMVLQNKESTLPKSRAGRARDRAERPDQPDTSLIDGSTIACVTGFLVNMVERSIQLVSPTPSDARRPRGYRVFGSRRFDTAQGFRAAIESLIAEHMPETIPAGRPLGFRRDLAYSGTEEGFVVEAHGARYTFTGGDPTRLLGRLMLDARHTVDEITAALVGAGLDVILAADLLQQLFDRGLIEDDLEEGVGPAEGLPRGRAA
jgi:radical SAM family RiPP maturation amino acid epimerase